MRLLPPLSRAEHAIELLDGPAPIADLSQTLDDVARLNGLFGGRRLTLTHLKRLVARLPAERALTVLDVGTGRADVPVALVRWARRTGRRIRVLALDHNRSTLRVAGRAIARYPEIVLLQGDALALPVRPRSVDVVISSLMLHHLSPDDAARSLAEAEAGARLGFVINDLMRSRWGYVIVWLATRVLARNRMSRHDGPLSVRRAYTPAETQALCEKARLVAARVFAYPALVRQCIVGAR